MHLVPVFEPGRLFRRQAFVKTTELTAAANDTEIGNLIRDRQEMFENAFVDGVIERAGSDGLARLWESEQMLPSPPEVDAPGLWLARIDLPGDA